jgi:hypothetical protein
LWLVIGNAALLLLPWVADALVLALETLLLELDAGAEVGLPLVVEDETSVLNLVEDTLLDTPSDLLELGLSSDLDEEVASDDSGMVEDVIELGVSEIVDEGTSLVELSTGPSSSTKEFGQLSTPKLSVPVLKRWC